MAHSLSATSGLIMAATDGARKGRRGCLSFPSHSALHCTHFSNNNRKETLSPISIPSFSGDNSPPSITVLCREALSQLCPGRFMVVFLDSRLSLDLLHSWPELSNLEQEKEDLCCAPAQYLKSYCIVFLYQFKYFSYGETSLKREIFSLFSSCSSGQ